MHSMSLSLSLPLLIADLVSFLKRCCQGLVSQSGIIVVKENIARDEDEFDDTDSSVTRYVSSLSLCAL